LRGSNGDGSGVGCLGLLSSSSPCNFISPCSFSFGLSSFVRLTLLLVERNTLGLEALSLDACCFLLLLLEALRLELRAALLLHALLLLPLLLLSLRLEPGSRLSLRLKPVSLNSGDALHLDALRLSALLLEALRLKSCLCFLLFLLHALLVQAFLLKPLHSFPLHPLFLRALGLHAFGLRALGFLAFPLHSFLLKTFLLDSFLFSSPLFRPPSASHVLLSLLASSQCRFELLCLLSLSLGCAKVRRQRASRPRGVQSCLS
jgi:hypothetical protein